MIIKVVTELILTFVNFARPNKMQICACAWIYRWTKKIVKNQDWAARRSSCRAVAGRGPLACF